MSNINQTIHTIYKGKGFIDTYSTDIFITLILCIVFFVAISYFYVMNNIKPIIADWDNQKCSPSVIPFAGLINNGPTTTKLEFTKKNFTSCMHTMVSVMAADAIQPIHYILSGFTAIFTDLKDALNDVRAEFNKIRNTVHMFTADVMGRSLNITLPIVEMVIGMKTMISKVIGVLGATQYTLFGSYLSLKSLFMFFLGVVNDILIGLVASIVASFILAIFFPPALGVALGAIAIMTFILIPTILIKEFVSDVFSLQTPTFPSVPSCFAADTLVEMADGTKKKIADIDSGDMLLNNIKVSATLKCSAQGQTIYTLDEVIVTGEHRVYHAKKGWIKVKDHEDSRIVSDFRDPFVYCLNTESKTITIHNTLFSDWDDIDATVLSHLETKCVNKGFLPKSFNGNDIHVYLDNGLDGTVSYVKTKKNGDVALIDIQVNDILDEGQRVVGIVKIDMSDIDTVYDYSLENTFIRSCRNLQTIHLDEHNNVEIKNRIECNDNFIAIKKTSNCFYQLLVEGGRYKVNGISIGDYNTGLDKFIL